MLELRVFRNADRRLVRVSKHLGDEDADEVFGFCLGAAVGFQHPSLRDLMHSAGKRISGRGVIQAEKDDKLGNGGSNTASDLDIACLEGFDDFGRRSLRYSQLVKSEDSLDDLVAIREGDDIFHAESLDHGALRDLVPDQAVYLLVSSLQSAWIGDLMFMRTSVIETSFEEDSLLFESYIAVYVNIGSYIGS
jgi:hypothetical protein